MDAALITYPPDLPVSERREEILDAIRDNQVVIIAGATGSGKTTQIPKMCLELGRTSIAHTQPRRIAARAVAERIAEELKVELGGLVGYQVRFTDQASAETEVKVMTDGILLNALQRDRMLSAYDTIIIDEAHERSLNIDFLLGYLKQLLPQRPDLKLIITSATIDPESFSKHFGGAPMIEVSGRTFPIEIRYRPLVEDKMSSDDVDDDELADEPNKATKAPEHSARDYLDGIISALNELDKEAPGDVLVFLSGETEIRDAQEALEGNIAAGRMKAGTEVLPLYGRLSAADQHKVFEPSKVAGLKRRIILATNVAETSLTVPGIKYVVDAGTARISRYSPRAKVQRLPIEAISQASANQRSGRCGRTSDGIAIRLYSEEDFERRPEFTDPEILRT
ncbi:MAG: helicase-related protein, partial [Candidatus Nanopelagicales bacterium]